MGTGHFTYSFTLIPKAINSATKNTTVKKQIVFNAKQK